jgi:hypothetical protein
LILELLVRTNTTLTSWQKRTGHDAHGEPTFTAQTGTWRVQAEPTRRRLQLEGREVVASLLLRIMPNPGIGVGDRVTILGSAYQVLEVQHVLSEALGHDVLLLQ